MHQRPSHRSQAAVPHPAVRPAAPLPTPPRPERDFTAEGAPPPGMVATTVPEVATKTPTDAPTAGCCGPDKPRKAAKPAP